RHLALTPTPSTASYTLSLHDALPILNVAESLTISTISDTAICGGQASIELTTTAVQGATYKWTPSTGLSNPNIATPVASPTSTRSEEHTSELQSRENLVCRLLLEKQN